MASDNSALVIKTDGTGTKDLNDIITVKFVVATNPPIGEKVVLDDQFFVSPIAEINKVRATLGSGDGSNGWVKVKEISPAKSTKEVQVQLSKVTEVTFATDGHGFAILKREGEMLGEVHDPQALARVKILFPQ
jgi:hypothetical protein